MKFLRRLRLSGLGVVSVLCLTTASLVWPVYSVGAYPDLIALSKDVIVGIISVILFYTTVTLNGTLATIAGRVLMYVAQFNNFTDLPVIVEAWSTVRDLSNMFFIVVLLVIAFGTLFRIEAYSWKKLLPKMILAAILVNYSRAICGFIVDASQVVMLTFVAAFKDALTVGLVEAFSLNKLLQFGTVTVELSSGGQTSSESTNRLLAIFMAGVMLGNLFVVMLVYIMLIVARLVMIWFLTVLSPLPFIANVLPQTEKYSSQWWEMFGRYVTLGPMMMFFLWLAMFIAAKSVEYGGLGQVSAGAELIAIEAANKSELQQWAGVFDTRLISGFIIADMMLIAGLKFAQDASSEFSEFTSKAADAGKFLTRTLPLKAGGALAEGRIDSLYQRTGFDLNVVRQYQKIQHKRADIKRKREAIGYGKAFTAAQKGAYVRSWLGAADFAYEQYTPVLGKQGMLGPTGHLMKGQLLRWRGNQIFENLTAQRTGIENQIGTARGALQSRERQLSEKYTTVSNREAAIAAARGSRQVVHELSDDGKGWDVTAGSEGRKVLENLKGTLDGQLKGARSVTEAKSIQGQIDEVKKALEGKGKVDLDTSVSGLGTSLQGAKHTRMSQLTTAEKNAFGKEVSANGKLITTQEDLNNVIRAGSASEQRKINELTEQRKALNHDIERYGPVIDYEGAQTSEAVLAEERKKYAGEENEDVLKGLLQGKIHEKDGIGALGVIQHSSSVGHLNEMMKMMQQIDPDNAAKYSIDVKGMREMADYLEKNLNVDHEMVMAAMNEASKSAKHNNHWTFAEAVTQRDGRYEWRTDAERQERQYVEASKRGVSALFRDTNRLGMGGYDADDNWKPEPAMMQLYVNAMPTLVDSAGKGFGNNSMGEHIFKSDGGIHAEQFREAIIKTHGADTENGRKALEAMELWKRSCQNKSGGMGSYQIAEDILKKAA